MSIVKYIAAAIDFLAIAGLVAACLVNWQAMGVTAATVAVVASLVFACIPRMPAKRRKHVEPRYICMRDVQRKYI